MKEIFTGISAKLETGVPAIRWIDFDLGQFDQQELPPVSWPCVLIGFADAPFQNIGTGGQLAEVGVYLLLGCKVYERTHSKAESTYRAHGLEHLDLIEDIHRAIDGLGGTSFSDLRRTNFQNVSRSDFRIYRLEYRCLFCDVPPSAFEPWDEATEDTPSEGVELGLDLDIEMLEPNGEE